VDESTAHAILDRSLERGINFIDTAEMYSVPTRAETYGATETIVGNWFAKNPGVRGKVVLATKVAGPSRGMPWVRQGTGLTAKDIVASCEASLKRLKTDVIDLYQIHWTECNVPMFGQMSGGQHDHWGHVCRATRGRPRRLGHEACPRGAGRDRQDSLGNPRSGSLEV